MTADIWHKCMHVLQSEISSQQFNTWIRPLKVLSDEQDICLLAPNKFVTKWIKEKFLQRIEEIIDELIDSEKEVPVISLAVASTRRSSFVSEKKNTSSLIETPSVTHNLKKDSSRGILKEKNNKKQTNEKQEKNIKQNKTIIKNNLNDSFAFDNFVEGESNKLALASALQVAENLGVTYNPLFLYGGAGLGKTHLMHAVGNLLFKKNNKLKVVYLHAERFVRDMIKSLQINAINEFKKYYRSVDALLIDDIQFFSGKERSQEEFFHTFNDLLDGGQQVILTCDRYPKEISGIDERLQSRFGWGLTVAIEPPDLKTRIAILKQKAKEYNNYIPENVATFIAARVRSNVRELEGTLKRLIASSSFLKQQINLNLAKDVLKDLIALHDKKASIENIQKKVASFYKIKVSDLLSKTRNRRITRPRQIGMAICKEITEHSFPEIGKAYGGRDHSTVIHACRKIKQLIKCDPEVDKNFKYLIKSLTI